MEYRCRTFSERITSPGDLWDRLSQPARGFVSLAPRPAAPVADNPCNRYCLVRLQHSAGLPVGWRKDFVVAVVVHLWTGSQPDDRDGSRLRRSHWFHWTCILVSRRVAGRSGCLYAAELLGRIEASARAAKNRKDTAPGRLCLPKMQFQTSIGSLLEVQQLPASVRHVSDWGTLPDVQYAIHGYSVSRLRLGLSDGSVDRGELSTEQSVI